jgi:hypothetical protein
VMETVPGMRYGRTISMERLGQPKKRKRVA